jgi:hypothetical protein
MASRFDINGMLSNIQSIFIAANTTGASPIDLSHQLSTRVASVMKVNPIQLIPEAWMFPMVTCYLSGKSTEDQTFAKSQANIKRRATLEIDVVGAIWNDTFNTSFDDPADTDIHLLMENIELILRSNETLSNAVSWSVPQRVDYYDARINEGSHLRSGILTLQATVFY